MLHVVRSELTRLGQLRTLLVWFGLMAVFAFMINAVMASVVGQAGAGGLPTPGVAFPTRQELEAPSGVMAGLSAASNMFGIVTLSLWAWFTAQDYSSGLIRLLVAAEPRRWRLLAGKGAALLLVTAVATTVAAGRLLEDPVASFGVATIASLVVLPVTWFHYPVALLPVAIAAAARAEQAARPATVAAVVAAVVAAGLAIVAPVVVWIAAAFVMFAIHVSRPRTS